MQLTTLIEKLKSKFRYRHPESYLEELSCRCSLSLVPGCVLAFFAWLPFIPLDLKLYPQYPVIIYLRLGYTFLGLLVLILNYVSLEKINPFFAKYKGYVLLMGLIGYMELSAGIIVGLVGDPVYVGGFCIVLLALVACPFKLTHIMILILISLLMFIGTGIYSGMSFELNIQKYGLVNLIETVVLAVFASFLNEYFRRNRFLNNLLIQKKSDEKLDQFLQAKGITKRETEILRLVLVGKSNNQIEDKLFISINTVKNHIYNIFQKMNVNSRVQLANMLRDVEKNW